MVEDQRLHGFLLYTALAATVVWVLLWLVVVAPTVLGICCWRQLGMSCRPDLAG
jgi:hypothetical protein